MYPTSTPHAVRGHAPTRPPRGLTLAALLFVCTALVACGGAAGSLPETAGAGGTTAAKVSGTILDVDGSSDLAAGVGLRCEETNDHITTDANGRFAFDSVPEGDITLALADAARPAGVSAKTDREMDGTKERDDGANDGQKDDAADDSEGDDGRLRLRRLRRGEHVLVILRIEDGRIVDVRITRADGDDGPSDGGGEREIELEMRRTRANTDPDMSGELELSLESNGDQEVEVEVEDATPGDLLEAVFINPEGDEESLGFRAVELDGDAEWKLDTGDGDELPFGRTRITGLEKHGVVVRDAAGVNLLVVRIPDFPPRDDERDFCFRLHAAARLMPAVDDVHGFVRMGARGCVIDGRARDLRQIFRMGAFELRPGQKVAFLVEDPANPGRPALVDTIVADREGTAILDLDTAEMERLPHGAGTIRILVGMRVEVRDADTDRLLLSGIVPRIQGDITVLDLPRD